MGLGLVKIKNIKNPDTIKKAIEGIRRSKLRKNRRNKIYECLVESQGKVPCYVCGEHVSRKQASLEHITPLSRGGTDDWDNLAISHRRCNSMRGDNERLSHNNSGS